MTLVDKYLDTMTLVAQFWIADEFKRIFSVENEGIVIKKSKTYLNAYFIDIFMKKAHYEEIQREAKGWQHRLPSAIITKGNGRVEAYDLTYLEAVEKDEMIAVKFAGKLVQDKKVVIN